MSISFNKDPEGFLDQVGDASVGVHLERAVFVYTAKAEAKDECTVLRLFVKLKRT
jgi:hypothetical protein